MILQAPPDPELTEHPAVVAWRSLALDLPAPEQVVAITGERPGRRTRNSAVYRLSRGGPDAYEVIAKRCRSRKAEIERIIYTEVLPNLPAPAIRLHGMVAAADPDYSWLFLEEAGGMTYSQKNRQHRLLAAEWLAQLHGCSAHLQLAERLPSAGPERQLGELNACRDTIQLALPHPELTTEERQLLTQLLRQYEALESGWNRIVRISEETPPTLVHGDFIAKNIRVRLAGARMELIPYDWETAGWGTPATDLAQHPSNLAASVNLRAYLATARQFWPGLSARRVQQLANLGLVLRLVSALHWNSKGLRNTPPRAELERPLSLLKFYVESLQHAVSRFGGVGNPATKKP